GVAARRCDPLPVKDRADVVRVNAFDHEGKYRGFFFGGADNLEPGDLGQGFGSIEQELVLVGGNLVHTDRVEVIDRRAESDAARDIGRTGFELVGEVVVRG